MKRIIFYFLALLAAVWLGLTMRHNSGYLLIAYNDLSIETSLWFAAVFLVVLFLVFYALLRFGSGIGAFASYIRRWANNRKQRRAHEQTVLGLYDLIEGNWDRAEKKLLRSAKYSDMPLVNYLAGAFMAKNQHAFKKQANYLGLVRKIAKDHPLAAGLAEASLAIGETRWEKASEILKGIYKLQPKNIFVLQLLQQVYLELNDWSNLEKLLPDLRKRRVFSAEFIDDLEIKTYKGLLLFGSQNDQIKDVWHKVPRYLHKDSVLASVYVEYLLSNDNFEEAEAVLKMALHKNLDKSLLKQYAKLVVVNPIKKLMRAEGWLKDNPKNPDLLLCLGKVCREQKLWGKACHYLEQSVKIDPSVEAYVELGNIMVEQRDLKSAVIFFDKGLKLLA